jgi:carlactone synthase/all-trans-10'-apo-beta-carotenal 13,14-cleaving dioxygenase
VDEKEFITLLPDLLNPGYTAVRMVAGSNKRKIIGRVRFLGPFLLGVNQARGFFKF